MTDSNRNSRKERIGTVVSNSMQNTAVVAVAEQFPHRVYKKIVKRTKKLYVDTGEETLNVGDTVLVAETRPLSKLKRWRLVEVVERAR